MIIAAAVLSGFFGFRFFIHRPSPWQHKTRRQTPPKVSSHSGPCLSGGGKKATVPAAPDQAPKEAAILPRATACRVDRRCQFGPFTRRAFSKWHRKANKSTGLHRAIGIKAAWRQRKRSISRVWFPAEDGKHDKKSNHVGRNDEPAMAQPQTDRFRFRKQIRERNPG